MSCLQDGRNVGHRVKRALLIETTATICLESRQTWSAQRCRKYTLKFVPISAKGYLKHCVSRREVGLIKIRMYRYTTIIYLLLQAEVMKR